MLPVGPCEIPPLRKPEIDYGLMPRDNYVILGMLAEDERQGKVFFEHAGMKKDEPKWKVVERVVKLIEESLSPDSRVEHNVSLPDLTLNHDSERQCDVVIWSGKPPRVTITIVEVQDRTRKVDITTFDGWCKKMERVGAQHLICVSTKGFPTSIKKEALKRGPTVRLVTLAELERQQWPIDFVENSLEYISVLEGKTKFNKIAMLRVANDRFLAMNYGRKEVPFFQYRGQNLELSIHDLVQMYAMDNDLAEGLHEVEFVLPEEGQLLYYLEDGKRAPIKHLGISAHIEIERGRIPLTFASYVQSSDTQIGDEQPIAWVMNAVGVFRGEEIDITAIFLPDSEGVLHLSHFSDITGSKLFLRFIAAKSQL